MAMPMASVPSCSCAVAAKGVSAQYRRLCVLLCRSPQEQQRHHALVVTMAEIRSVMPAIVLTEEALKHLNKLRADQNKDLCLRVGIRQGVAWECHM
ncbi:unnamed protein product [Sphagnum jensenii]|uniref:Uncharacterized protein n=1 Tax=Sphagnum jensenii TaxID=128206 RepID=A0ABP0XH39_9BRYO